MHSQVHSHVLLASIKHPKIDLFVAWSLSTLGESGDAIGSVEPTGSYAYGSTVPIACPLSPISESSVLTGENKAR